MILDDPWHYPRTQLAKQVLSLFETGLSSSLTFFAPRRMGKTEFLCKDITPLAVSLDWHVFYFSFLDISANTINEFTAELYAFANDIGAFSKTRGILQKVSKISGEGLGVKTGIELRESKNMSDNLKNIVVHLNKHGKILLLLDEIQTLAEDEKNENFVASLRTALDLHKDNIKVIFTGSSQSGLRKMFSQAKAPFFHFGQNLPFPDLDKEFIEHLVMMFKKATKRELDTDMLFTIFQEMQKVPQLARSLVERLALNPQLSLEEGKKQLLDQTFADRHFNALWNNCSALEKCMINVISNDESALFSHELRQKFASELGLEISEVAVSTVQSAQRSLEKKGIIVRKPEQSGYTIDDPNFKSWILSVK
jgi:hypothetical protein